MAPSRSRAGRVAGILAHAIEARGVDSTQDALVVIHIRLPRLFLAMMIGAALAMSGALMQGLFRNPLADPGLAGVSAGAGLGAALAIVLGDRLPQGLNGLGSSLLPAAAFLGALAATSTLYAVATRGGRTSVATMLLAGVALAALASSFIGILAYVSDDRQLRDLTFWSMGSLGGANWVKVAALAPVTALMLGAAPFLSRGLNALALGEAEAYHLGVRLQRLKAAIVFLVAMAVGASVAAAGVISFVGIVAPHAVRLIGWPGSSRASAAQRRGGSGPPVRRRRARAHAGRARGNADRRSDRGNRRAVLPLAIDAPRRRPWRLSAFLSAHAASYSSRRRPLVDAVSLDVTSGLLTVLIGPNGAGKSTLIRLMSGELHPTSGRVLCEGQDLARFSPERLALRRAVMTQAIQVSSPFLAHEIVRLGIDGIGRVSARERARIIEQCLVAADALPFAARSYANLSGGEQRRVQFARALAQIEAARTVHDRQALLLDEPVANLDLPHQLALLDAARKVARQGVAVLAVLHDFNLASRYADVLALMNKGAIVACGDPASVQRSDLLSEVFAVDLAVGTILASDKPLVMPSRWLTDR